MVVFAKDLLLQDVIKNRKVKLAENDWKLEVIKRIKKKLIIIVKNLEFQIKA